MTLSLKHTFVSGRGDGADSSLVQPSNWNAEHTITLGSARLVGRTTAGTGNAEEISVGTRLALSGGSLGFSAGAEALLTGSLQTTGGTMSGDLNLGTHKVTNLGTPTASTDAATMAYADLKIAADGTTTITADLPLNTHKITGLGTPTASTDAATKAYADGVGSFAWGRVTGGTTPNFSGTSKNFASVTRLAKGLYQFAFTTNYSNTNYIPIVTRVYNASDFNFAYIHYISVITSAGFTVQFYETITPGVEDSFDFIVAVMGGN